MKFSLKNGVLLFFLLLLLAFPMLFPNPAVTSIAVFALTYAAAAIGWNSFSGYTGYISLGHSAYFGVGAYTVALACQDWHIAGGPVPFFFIPFAGLVAGLFALPLGWFALATRRFLFVSVTIAIFYILQLLTYNLPGITNGSGGVYLPLPPWSGDVFNIPFYYVALALLLFALFVSWRIRSSQFGLGLLAIRDDEDRAQGYGIRTNFHKLSAYVISAVIVGMAGALNGYFVGILYPSFAFSPNFDLAVALSSFLGGVGTPLGPLLGAVIIVPAQQYLTSQFGENGVNLMLIGGLLLVVVYLLPEGIIPSLHRLWRNRQSARANKTMVSHSKVVERQEVQR